MRPLIEVHDYRLVRDLRTRVTYRFDKNAPIPVGYVEVPDANSEDGRLKPKYWARARLDVILDRE